MIRATLFVVSAVIAAALMLVGFASTAHASTTATATSSLGGPSYQVSNAVDGNITTGWQSEGVFDDTTRDPSPAITFTFDQLVPVLSMDVWNLGSSGGRGIYQADVLASTDGTNFTTDLGVKTFNIGAPDIFSSGTPTDQLILLGVSQAKAIRFNILQNWFGHSGYVNGDFDPYTGTNEGIFVNTSIVGVNEVVFNTPEPASLGLLGIGGLMLLKRRRRQ